MTEVIKPQQGSEAASPPLSLVELEQGPAREAYSGPLTQEELNECRHRWSTTGPTPWSFGKDMEALVAFGLRREVLAEAIEKVKNKVYQNKAAVEVFGLNNGVNEEDVDDFVATTIRARDARHQLKGYKNHGNRLGRPVNPEQGLYLKAAERPLVERRAELGVATPLELLKLCSDTGMGSIELGRAIGGDELLAQLEKEVSQAVAEFGGAVVLENDDRQTRVKVRALNGVKGNGGSDILTVTKREVFAKCGATYIMRRSSYLVPKKMIDRTFREATGLSSIPSRGDEQEWLQEFNQKNSETLVTLSGWLDQETVGVSTTFYAVDKETIEAINKRSSAALLGARATSFAG